MYSFEIPFSSEETDIKSSLKTHLYLFLKSFGFTIFDSIHNICSEKTLFFSELFKTNKSGHLQDDNADIKV